MDSPKLREEVGKKIKVARLKAKLTQAEVANKADIGTNYFAQIERGEVNPSLEKLHKISEVLGIRALI